MAIWTNKEALDFAKASAEAAIDQRRAYAGGIEEAADSYKDNLRDTLQEYHATQHEDHAFAIFESIIQKAVRADYAAFQDARIVDDYIARVYGE